MGATAQVNPRLICALGTNHGQLATVSLAKKLGMAKMTPSTTLNTMAICFQREKCSMAHSSCFGLSATIQ
jgi:hypothetical protein